MNKAEPRWNIPLNQSKLWPTYPEAATALSQLPFPGQTLCSHKHWQHSLKSFQMQNTTPFSKPQMTETVSTIPLQNRSLYCSLH